MSNRNLRYLEAILETGSILGASRRLYVSQPGLSQYVKRIEADYGITVFNRQTTPWTLTEEGEELMEALRAIEKIDRECRQRFEDRKNYKTGQIRIASTAYRTATLLNPVLSHFKKDYPGIVVRIEEGNAAEVMSHIEAGHVDCGVVISSMIPSTLEHIRIYGEEVLLALPSDHPYVKARPKPPGRFDELRLTEIAGTPFIIMKVGQIFHEYFYQLCASNGIELPVTLETQSILTVPALVETGIGAALVPSTIVDECLRRNIAIYRPVPAFASNDVSVAWKQNRYCSYATRLFIRRALEVLGPEAIGQLPAKLALPQA